MDEQATRPGAVVAVHECRVRRAVVRPRWGVVEVDLEDGDVPAREQSDDARPNAHGDRLPLYLRPRLDAVPVSSHVSDLNVGREQVAVGPWHRRLMDRVVEARPSLPL